MEKYLPEDCLPAYEDLLSFLNPDKVENYSVSEWKGFCMSQAFPAETVKFAYENFEPRESDIIIASYPKTGTTWVREILRQMLYYDDPKSMEISKDLSIPVLYIECGKPSKYKVVDNVPISRRCFITHMPPDVLNMEKFRKKNVKIISLVRNPKDQLVSHYHFFMNLPYTSKYKVDGTLITRTWNGIFKDITEGQQAVGLKKGECYLDYLRRWNSHSGDSNVLTVVYEELIADPCKEIKRIAEHVGKDLSDEKISEISDLCSFSSMSKPSKDPGLDEVLRNQYKLVRKGGIGGWKNYFTVAQSEQMDQMAEEKLKETGIKFTYE